jgi:predicted DNA-binding transcriptional regulator YafY
MAREENQKLKILYVAKFFLENSDPDHLVTTNDIIDYLKEECGIEAGRQSIYRDVAALRDVYGMDIIDTGRGGRYKLLSRDIDYEDLFILAQCVYSTRFISEKKAEDLVEKLGKLCSTYQAERLRTETYYPERVRMTKKDVLNTVALINECVPKSKYRLTHRSPQMIKFRYVRHDISDLKKEVEKHNGKEYCVFPIALVINDGYYYLLAREEGAYNQLRTYRVDRMRNVKIAERTFYERISKDDIQRYTESAFSMYDGEKQNVTIRFENELLDTVIDRFGLKGVSYSKDGTAHFTITTEIAVSVTFFGWLCQFGTRAMIQYPKEVAKQYQRYLKDIIKQYKETSERK